MSRIPFPGPKKKHKQEARLGAKVLVPDLALMASLSLGNLIFFHKLHFIHL